MSEYSIGLIKIDILMFPLTSVIHIDVCEAVDGLSIFNAVSISPKILASEI